MEGEFLQVYSEEFHLNRCLSQIVTFSFYLVVCVFGGIVLDDPPLSGVGVLALMLSPESRGLYLKKPGSPSPFGAG